LEVEELGRIGVIFRTENLIQNVKGKREYKRKRWFKILTLRRGPPKLVFQILLSGAEPSVKDALAIFCSIQNVCKK
jgi:hypothetical protein